MHRVKTLHLKPPRFEEGVTRFRLPSDEYIIAVPRFSRSILLTPAPLLERVSIIDVDWPDSLGAPFAGHCPNLCTLTIGVYSNFSPCTFSACGLLTLEVKDRFGSGSGLAFPHPMTICDIQFMLLAFPLLQSLSLKGFDMSSFQYSRPPSQTVVSAKHLQNLTILSSILYDKGLRALFHSVVMPSIQRLAVSYSPSRGVAWFDAISDHVIFARLLASSEEVAIEFDSERRSVLISMAAQASTYNPRTFTESCPKMTKHIYPDPTVYSRELEDTIITMPAVLSPLSPAVLKIGIPDDLFYYPSVAAWRTLFTSFSSLQSLSLEVSGSPGAADAFMQSLTSATSCPALQTLSFTNVELESSILLRMLRARQTFGVGINILYLHDCVALKDPDVMKEIMASVVSVDTTSLVQVSIA